LIDVDEQAIECHKIATDGARDTEVVKSKESLQVISALRHQPILKCGKQYAVIDGQTAYIYEDKQ
jgi:hypothetical protein